MKKKDIAKKAEQQSKLITFQAKENRRLWHQNEWFCSVRDVVAALTDSAILTAEISKATFGVNSSHYKSHKNLPAQSKANLRDHMDDLALIFAMLGERVTTAISQSEEPDIFLQSKHVA